MANVTTLHSSSCLGGRFALNYFIFTFTVIADLLYLYAQTPQHGQIQSNNSSAVADENV